MVLADKEQISLFTPPHFFFFSPANQNKMLFSNKKSSFPDILNKTKN